MATLQDICGDQSDSRTLRGLVSVLNDKLQMQARYALLEYEANMEGRSACSRLYQALNHMEADQIERLSSVLVRELQPARLSAA